MRHPRFLAAAVSLAALPGLVGCGTAPDPPLGLNDVLFAGDRFVAVGRKERPSGGSGDAPATGAIITSTDGTAWKQVDVDVDLPLWSVAQGNGRLVAVGGSLRLSDTGRHGVVMVSDDGHAWERVAPDPDAALAGVAYGNGRFVALAFDLRVLTSADGHDWALAEDSRDLDAGIHDLAFGNGIFVTSSGTADIEFATDGVAWTFIGFGYEFVRSVSFAGGAFFAGLAPPYCPEPCVGPFPVARSTDGVDWTRGTEDLGGSGLAGVAHQDGVFVGAIGAGLVRSTDGATWSPGSGVENRGWAAVAAGPPGFVAVGSGFVAHSADGAAWAEVAVDVE